MRNHILFCRAAAFSSTLIAGALHAGNPQQMPNVIFILADDIGYGDIGCYGAKNISTPNIDALAAQGVRFANAYAPASTSSPSRYALLTGEYAWRKKVGIMAGDAPLSIDLEKNNLPKQMKSVGYVTAIVGKWHLGLGEKGKPVDFNQPIECGMRAVGFDYSYIFPATNDRVPTIYMENDRTVGLDGNDPIRVSYKQKIGEEPTGKENPELLKLAHFRGHDGTIVNGIGRIGWMEGGKSARWTDETMAETFLDKAERFIENNASRPFFLYYATHNAHEPRVPGNRFKGKSKAGIYGDVVEEFDYCVGRIVETLRTQGILENTLIIVSSDNGPMVKEGYLDGALENIGEHDPYGGLRGAKYSLYEGGSRVPFIACWGKKIEQPFVQEQQFCYMDMLATIASLTNSKAFRGSFNDSKNAADLFLKPDARRYRPYIVTQNNGGALALRKGYWKYIPAHGKMEAELYDLSVDSDEKKNLVKNESLRPLVEEFIQEIERLKGNG